MSPARTLQLQILIFVPLFFLPAADVIIHPAHQQWNNEKAESLNTARRLVQYVAASDRQLMEQTRLLLEVLSKSPPVIREDSESCRSLFSNIVNNQQYFSNIEAADQNGDVFCNAASSARTNIADREYFQQAMRTRRFVFSDYAPALSSGKHSIDLVYPWLSETGQPQGVIFASLDLKTLVQIPEKSLPENSEVLIVDSKGTILAACPNVNEWIGRSLPDAPVIKAMLSQKEGLVGEKCLDGVVRNFAFTSVTQGSSGELHIAAGLPEKPFNWLSGDMLQNAAVLLGIMALFGFAAGWLAARHLPGES
ncbi:MAG: cache domain-containing protein [Syntrophobacteraceae bacterium]